MNTLHFLIALTLGISTAHAASDADSFFQEIGVSSEALNENGMELVEQGIAQNQENLDAITTPTPNPVDEIPEGELKILGKGFSDRDTGDSLALAYYSGPSIDSKNMDACTRVRHVFFDGTTRKAHYIGPDYVVSCGSTSSPKEVEQSLKELNQDFKKFRRKANHNRNFWFVGGIGMALAPIVSFASPASLLTATAGGIPPALGIYVGAMVVWCIVATVYNNHQTLFAHSAGGSSILIDRDGWNWASNPKNISHRTFKLYLKFIHN